LIVKEFAKIGVRIIALILILLLCNWLYVEFFFEKDLEKHSSIIYKIRALDADTDILYLGESSNKTFDTNDLDRRKISQMLSEFYPDLKIRDITEPAAHLGIYYEILRKIPGDSNVKTVVVTLNLRSFGLDWIYSKLESSLQKSLLLLKPYPPLVNRFLLSFKAYPSYNEEERTKTIRRLWQEEAFDTLSGMPYSSVSEWDRAMSRKGIRDTLGRYDQAMTELACHYIKSYAFTMNKHYRIRIQDMDRIITLAKKRNWHLVFNLMAENVDKAELLVGEDLLSLMRENRDYLVSYLGERSISVADNLEAVEDKEFIDQDWTTEHYKQKGRRIIARNLAKELKPFYAENYAESANDYTSPFEFFHDCEQNYNWRQEQGLSDEFAFSGKRSLRVDQKNPYGLTFACHLQQLPEHYRNGVVVSFMSSANPKGATPKLVLDLTDSLGQNHWNGIPISNTGLGEWSTFQTNIDFPPSTQSIKIYVLNDSDQPQYVDDLKITFY
jgi:hypothetical protein